MRAFFKFLTTILFGLLLCSLTWAGPKEGAAFRNFLADVTFATTIDEPMAKAASLRTTFIEHSPLFSEISDEKKFQQLLKDADLSDSAQIVISERENEIISQIRKHAISLPKDKSSLFDFFRKGKDQASELASAPIPKRKEFFEKIPNSAFLEFSDVVAKKIKTADFSKNHSLQLIIRDLKNIEISGLTPKESEQLGPLFLRYYQNLSLPDKSRILHSWLRLPPGTPLERQLVEILQHSGPVMQKIFQLVGRDTSSPELKKIMSELLANVKPFSSEVAKHTIEAELQSPIQNIFNDFSPKPLAAGTIGQVHSATLKNGTHVVIKVLRPNIKAQMLEDIKLLEVAAENDPIFIGLIQRLQAGFLRETNLGLERENLKKLQAYNNPKRGIHVPAPIAITETSQKILVMKKADGIPLASFTDLDPRIKGTALYNALYSWFNEAMFGSGFFHGDMHPGNMLITLNKSKKPKYQLTILDPGSADQLTLEQRRNFLRLVYSIFEKNPDHILQNLRAFGEASKIDEAALRKDIFLILENKRSAMETSGDLMLAAVRRGIELDPSVVLFSRAHMLITKEIERNNLEIKRLYPHAKPIKPNNAYIRSALRHANVEIPRALLGKENEAVIESGPLRQLMLSRLKSIYGSFRASCANFFRRLKGKA